MFSQAETNSEFLPLNMLMVGQIDPTWDFFGWNSLGSELLSDVIIYIYDLYII